MSGLRDRRAVRRGDLAFARAEGGDMRATLDLAVEALASVGAPPEDVIDVVSFHLDARALPSELERSRGVFGDVAPAWTPMPVVAQAGVGIGVAARLMAHCGDGPKREATPDSIAWWRELPVPAGCRKGDLLCVSGLYGSDADGNVNTPGDHAGQARNALNRVDEVVRMLGGRPEDVIDVWSAHQDPRGIEPVMEMCAAERSLAPGAAPAAWTAVGVPALHGFGMFGQYRAMAEAGGGVRAGVTPEGSGWIDTPAGAGAAKRSGRLVAVAAQLAAGGDADAAFDAVESTLSELGASVEDVLAVQTFHVDVRDLEAFAAVAERRLAGSEAVWTAVGVTGLWDPAARHAVHALAARP